MSLESARKLIEKLESDAELQHHVMELIRKFGFSCTLEELRVAARESLTQDESRLGPYKHLDCLYLLNPLGYKKCLYSSTPHEHNPLNG